MGQWHGDPFIWARKNILNYYSMFNQFEDAACLSNCWCCKIAWTLAFCILRLDLCTTSSTSVGISPIAGGLPRSRMNSLFCFCDRSLQIGRYTRNSIISDYCLFGSKLQLSSFVPPASCRCFGAFLKESTVRSSRPVLWCQKDFLGMAATL